MHLVHGDARSLPFADATFDAVTAITVLCFLDAPQRAISEMVRVLRPGGRLVIGELGRHSIWAARRRMSGWLGSTRWRLARFWSPRELCGIAESAGMRVVVVRGAVYYPPCDLCARLLGPIDARLAALSRFGAAFIAVAADRPMNGTPNAKCPRATCRRS
jgi:SAM-dependent methyltransferase